LRGLPRPLLNRMTVLEIARPAADQAERILQTLRSDLARELQIQMDDLPELEPEAKVILIEAIRAGAAIREIGRALRRALAASVGTTMLH
jgi:hypothetical protein